MRSHYKAYHSHNAMFSKSIHCQSLLDDHSITNWIFYLNFLFESLKSQILIQLQLCIEFRYQKQDTKKYHAVNISVISYEFDQLGFKSI